MDAWRGRGRPDAIASRTRWSGAISRPGPSQPSSPRRLGPVGQSQARPFDKPLLPKDTYSRAVEYEIDEDYMKVRELWASEEMGPDRVVSMAMGDVEWLPQTENILVGFGALVVPESVDGVTWDAPSRLNTNQWTRSREYARGPDEVVFEIDLRTGRPDLGWTLFGVERIDQAGPSALFGLHSPACCSVCAPLSRESWRAVETR